MTEENLKPQLPIKSAHIEIDLDAEGLLTIQGKVVRDLMHTETGFVPSRSPFEKGTPEDVEFRIRESEIDAKHNSEAYKQAENRRSMFLSAIVAMIGQFARAQQGDTGLPRDDEPEEPEGETPEGVEGQEAGEHQEKA